MYVCMHACTFPALIDETFDNKKICASGPLRGKPGRAWGGGISFF